MMNEEFVEIIRAERLHAQRELERLDLAIDRKRMVAIGSVFLSACSFIAAYESEAHAAKYAVVSIGLGFLTAYATVQIMEKTKQSDRVLHDLLVLNISLEELQYGEEYYEE